MLLHEDGQTAGRSEMTGSSRPISGMMVSRIPFSSPCTRARALMARQWSARCYGVAWQREGSRQNGIGGGSGVLSLRHFGLVLFIPLSLGAWGPKNLARRSMEVWLRRRRRRFRLSDFRFEAAAATLSGTGSVRHDPIAPAG